jgi:hypothetical protein
MMRMRRKNLDVSGGRADDNINPGGDDSDATLVERGFDDVNSRRRRDEDEAARVDAEMNTDADRDDDDDDTFLAGDTGENGSGSVEQLERARRAMKGSNNMKTHSELMSAVVKKYGLTAFAKSVVAGDVHCTESELCKLIEETAKRENISFSKLFEAQDERGLAARSAIAAARDAGFLSRLTSERLSFG